MTTSRPVQAWLDLDSAFLIQEHVAKFYDYKDVPIPEFKNVVWSSLPGNDNFQSAVLNVYWTRSACGVTMKGLSQKKDVTSFYFGHGNLNSLVAIKTAQLTAPCPLHAVT